MNKFFIFFSLQIAQCFFKDLYDVMTKDNKKKRKEEEEEESIVVSSLDQRM